MVEKPEQAETQKVTAQLRFFSSNYFFPASQQVKRNSKGLIQPLKFLRRKSPDKIG